MRLRKAKPGPKKTATREYTVQVTTEYLQALRRDVGRLIDPETAEIVWHAVQLIDPYDDDPDLPPEYMCIDDDFFVRVPGTDLWIVSGDLPKATFDRIWKRCKSQSSRLGSRKQKVTTRTYRLG